MPGDGCRPATLAAMITRVAHVLAAVTAAAVCLLLTAAPALATEAGGGGGGGEGGEKITLPDNPHDQVGLIFLAFFIAGSVWALVNAWRRLRGEGDRASGEWRYR